MSEFDEAEEGAGVERESSSWRWIVGLLLLAGLAGIVAFAVHRARQDPVGDAGRTERSEDGQPSGDTEGKPVAGVARGDVNYIVFCAAAQPGKAGLDIRDALDQLALPSFPAKISFAVVVSLTADRPGRRYEFVRFDESGKVDFAQELKLGGGIDFASVNFVRITDMQLAAPREVVFRVFRDGETIAERILPIGEAPTGGGPSKPAEVE